MYKKVILITGGAGFIGSHLVRHFVNKYPDYLIINYDALTYAGNLENLTDLVDEKNYAFVQGNINDYEILEGTFLRYGVTDVINLAAESHVDRSIIDPESFLNTNVLGTYNLLMCCKEIWAGDYDNHRFHHASTDEVYGALPEGSTDKFTENTKYDPHSPYSASKASSDHFVKAFHDTYGLNVTISNCSNNYGPNQFPEKLIPLVIDKARNHQKIPVYGTGKNVRDWLYVEDHCRAIDLIFHSGTNGETYNVGGNCEKTNIEIIEAIAHAMAFTYNPFSVSEPVKKWKILEDSIVNSIEYVKDRAGHDFRYAIDSSKIQKELGWKPEVSFEDGIKSTVMWYLENQKWVDHCKTGEYRNWLQINYGNREEKE